MDEKTKEVWWKRPVAWACAFLGVLGIQAAAYLLCELGIWVLNWLNGLSTVAIVILVLVGGGVFCALFLHSMVLIPLMVVEWSNKIYRSRHGWRYVVLGVCEIFGCVFLIFAGIMGAVKGGPMVWFYIRFAYILIASIYLIVGGLGQADPKEEREKRKDNYLVPVVLAFAVAALSFAIGLEVGNAKVDPAWDEGYSAGHDDGYAEGKNFQRNWDTDKMTVGGQNLKDIVNDVAEEYGIEPAEAYDILSDYNDRPDHGGYSWDEYQEAIQVIIYTVSLMPYSYWD